MEKFGEYIRSARLRRGWSLREAAEKTRIAYSRLHELETGISTKTRKPIVPTKRNIEMLSKSYQLPIDHLFALAHFSEYLKTSEGLSGEELGVIDVYRRLSPGKRRLWLTVGEGLFSFPDESSS